MQHQLTTYRSKLLRLCVLWKQQLIEVPLQYELSSEWGPSKNEMAIAAAAIKAGSWLVAEENITSGEPESDEEEDEGDYGDAEFIEELESQAMHDEYHFQSYQTDYEDFESVVSEDRNSNLDHATPIARARGSQSPRKRSRQNSWIE